MANSNTKIYDSAIVELEQWYKLAQKNKDNKQFYNYLYAYIGVISENEQLFSVIKNLELQEILSAPEGDKKLELLREQTLTARSQKGLTAAQKTYFQDEMLRLIETSRLKETQLSYWWYLLYNSFYNVYKRDFGEIDIHKVTRIDPKSVEKSLEKLNVKPSEVQILQLKNPSEEEKSELKRLNHTIANFEPTESQEVYVTCLNLLHIKLVSWLGQHSDITQKTEQASPLPLMPKDSIEPKPQAPNNVKIVLTIKGKVLWLAVNGERKEMVKRFSSKSGNNFRACSYLLNHRGRPLRLEDMGVVAKSRITDIPKTMGLVGDIADLFLEVDTKNQKIKILDNVEIQQQDLPSLIKFVQHNFQNNSDSSDS